MNKPTQPIRAVIFDCDGVLVDSEILASQVSLRMLEPYGFRMSPQEYARAFAGKVEQDILSIIQHDYHIELPDDFLSKLRLEIEHALDHDLGFSEKPWGFDFSSYPAVDFAEFDPLFVKSSVTASSSAHPACRAAPP